MFLGGWLDGGSKRRFKDCLQQSQIVHNFNIPRFERVLSAAQAAKVIVKKLKPEELRLLEATLNASSEGKVF